MRHIFDQKYNMVLMQDKCTLVLLYQKLIQLDMISTSLKEYQNECLVDNQHNFVHSIQGDLLDNLHIFHY